MHTYRQMLALQHAAEFDLVSRDVRMTGVAATLFGVLALFLGVTPPADPFAIGLGAFLSAIGLWNLTNPRPLGIAGLSTHRYLGGPWETLGSYRFRG